MLLVPAELKLVAPVVAELELIVPVPVEPAPVELELATFAVAPTDKVLYI